MQILEINLPDLTLRKIRALNTLKGGDPSTMEALLVDLIDRVVTTDILTIVESGVSNAPQRTHLHELRRPIPIEPVASNITLTDDDPSGVADGLSDEYEKDIDDLLPPSFKTPGAHGARVHSATTADIFADDQVDDPMTEAIGNAPPAKVGQSAEDSFAELTGLPPPPEARREIKATGKKKSPRRRGDRPLPSKVRVRAHDGNESEF